MNRFYQWPASMKWSMALLLLMVGFVPALFIIVRGSEQPLFYFAFFLYLPVAQFAMTPLFTLLGLYRYSSPLLLGYLPNEKVIDLHSGGSFDYLFVMRGVAPGAAFRKQVLKYQLEGLLRLIQYVEEKQIPESVSIVGTSYFFNEKTLQKFGFKLVEASAFYRLNLLVNFIDHTWMYSLAQGKLSFPKLWKAKKAHISGAALVRQRAAIAAVYERL